MNEIIKIEIDMLDVGAADAFIIHAFIKEDYENENEYIVLVDAGNEGDGEKILQHIKKYYKKQCIDLAICTHCENDHFGGYKELIEEHNKHGIFTIKDFWVNNPYKHVNVDDVKYIRNNKTLHERLDDLYSFSDGTNLLQIIDEAEIMREEAFTGKIYNPLNIVVLGPDEDYFNSLIPEFRVDLDFKTKLEDEIYDSLYYSKYRLNELYGKALEIAEDDKSKVNQSSIVFSLCFQGKVFLFTGDAGRESLQKIINKDDMRTLKNIHWLKVPHHGSKHNLDLSIISYFHPITSYISTENYGKYANRCTVNVLKQVGVVYSTHENGTISYQV